MPPRRTWLPKRTSPPKPKVPDDVRAAVDALAAPVVAQLKRRFCKPQPKNPKFNWPEDVFVRWHRSALYFVAVMRTPHGLPPTFETHVARLQYAGNGKFDLAVPMRRGWNTFFPGQPAEQCLQKVAECVYM